MPPQQQYSKSYSSHRYVPSTPPSLPGQSPRKNLRDDYSRSQHSLEDDAWTPPQPAPSPERFESPPRSGAIRRKQPPASDPGVQAIEQDRFAAYVNRFATIDPRMDYSANLSPQASPARMLEEKKDEHARYLYRHKQMAAGGDYPDPDFSLQQVEAAEYHKGNSTAMRSPGANRTRHLAQRFEGRAKAPVPSWHRETSHRETSSYSGSRRVEAHFESGSRRVDAQFESASDMGAYEGAPVYQTMPPPVSQTTPPAVAMDVSADVSDNPDYKSRSEIETPSPARVQALKEKLWDATESLQVKVRPSLHMEEGGPIRAARSLSPKTSRRVYEHFSRPSDPAPVQQQAPPPSHFEWSESRRPSADDRSTGRDDRSRSSHHTGPRDDRSYHTSGRDDRSRSSFRDDRSRSSHNDARRIETLSRSSAPRDAEGNGELANSPFFKSRFYSAAAQTVERRTGPPSLSRANSSGSSQGGGGMDQPNAPSRYFQRQMEAANEEAAAPVMAPSPSAAGASSWQSRSRPPSVRSRSNSVGGASHASTSRMTNHQESVTAIMAKIQSINRADPTAALREIDAILKAESNNSVQGEPVAVNVEPAVAEPDQEEEDDDSEAETTVSSITNPTFSGQTKRRKPKKEHPPKPRLPTTIENEAHTKPLKEAATDVEKRAARKNRSPPPDTIKVSGSRGRKSGDGLDRTQDTNLNPLLVKYEMGEEDVDDVGPADALAEKIRRWDELSGKGSAPETRNPDIMSDTTDALGSIVTPLVDSPQKHPHHPWDASIATRRGKINMRDTSMDNGTGIETQYKPRSPRKLSARGPSDERNNPFAADERNNPFAQESDHDSYATESREGSKPDVSQDRVMDLSADFDEAWVAMPSSAFFTDTTPTRQAVSETQKEDTPPPSTPSRASVSDDSPPPPPVSTKQASVQKFSPKRAATTKREIDYNPPSPSRHIAQSSAGAYDEKKIDQATSDESYDDGFEVTLVGAKKEPQRRKGLRALLQRRNSKSQLTGASSVVSGTRRGRTLPAAAYAVEADDNASRASPTRRGRRFSKSPSRNRARSQDERRQGRARSLEERRIKNPNIARKFSRFVRVYADDPSQQPGEF
jgi:hypothetical protein